MRATLVIVTVLALGVIGISAKFLVAPTLMSHYEGALYCRRQPGEYTLVLPRSLRESSDLYHFIRTNKEIKRSPDTGVKRVWANGKRSYVDNKWRDDKGNPLDKHLPDAFWHRDEPNNYKEHEERCLEMRELAKNNGTHHWNDAPCKRLNNVVCETVQSS